MDYKVFYRKYRPKNFNELVGQDSIKDILVNSIKLNKIAHAYIFTGPRGTGKTSTAKIFAKTLNCIDNNNGLSCDLCDMCKSYNESADIIEIDAASNNGVEEIRSLRDSVKIAPYNSKYKVYIIDEVHMLSNSAWNAFLKTLEEPPRHVIFILATTEINKIPDTVMSRCQRFDFSKIPQNLMLEHLSNICKKENIKITDEALNEISKLSNGCLRDALSYLDKISKYNVEITVDLIEENFGILNNVKLENLFNAIDKGNIKEINKLLDEISVSGITPLNFINEFVEFLLNKIINGETNKVNDIKDLIYKLNNLIINFNSVVNPFTLIKVELISLNYFPGNNFVNISHENEKVVNDNVNVQKNKVLNNNILVEEINKGVREEIKQEETEKSSINFDKIKQIRINNSFSGASKDVKVDFINKWKEFLNKLNIDNDYNILGYVENANIVVSSKTNTMFAFEKESESLLFNANISVIEDKFNELNDLTYKFISLSNEEWNVEKSNFINNKDKKYEYIEEIVEEESFEAKDLAENIFGNDIIEIR